MENRLFFAGDGGDHFDVFPRSRSCLFASYSLAAFRFVYILTAEKKASGKTNRCALTHTHTRARARDAKDARSFDLSSASRLKHTATSRQLKTARNLIKEQKVAHFYSFARPRRKPFRKLFLSIFFIFSSRIFFIGGDKHRNHVTRAVRAKIFLRPSRDEIFFARRRRRDGNTCALIASE